MHFDKERWERIRFFADANGITPERFVEACVDAVMLAQLQTEGPAIIQDVLDVRADRRRAHREKVAQRAEAHTRPGGKARLTHGLGDKLKAALKED